MIFKKLISIPIYDDYIEIVFTDDMKEAFEKYGEEYENCSGVTIELKDKIVVIFPIKNLEYKTMVHESYHAAISILEDKSVKDEESTAYLLDFIFGHIEIQYKKALKKFYGNKKRGV